MDLILLFKIGFLTISIWDVLDILIVGYLFFVLYKLSKGSLAFNILIGAVILTVIYWLVNAAEMSLLSGILGGLANFGFIVLIVVFQPEIRRFLIFLGRNFLKGRSSILKQILGIGDFDNYEHSLDKIINKVINASEKLASTKTGALIVFTENPTLYGLDESGVLLDSNISSRLMESIFHKESPLHDGAMVISNYKIYSAGSVLPVSDSKELPDNAGLRHRAAVGITEKSDAFVIIVSEETGKISTAKGGKLYYHIDQSKLHEALQKALVKSSKTEETTKEEN
jgi:diadenylate cyclase